MNPENKICAYCDRSFNRLFNLKRHYKEVHTGLEIPLQQRRSNHLVCPACNENFSSYKNLNQHLLTVHHIKQEVTALNFNKADEFYTWKSELEGKEKSLYVKRSAGKRLADKKSLSVTFYCHRSGNYRPHVSPSCRKRHIKLQGTNKLNACCPSKIQAIFLEEGPVKVTFHPTHFGHQKDLSHLHLSCEERKKIATKIASKIPLDIILEDIRSTVDENEGFQRKHLVNKDDLKNIIREFSLDAQVVFKRPNHAVSVDAWVEQEQSSDSCCVLLYKRVGELSKNFPSLKENDFALAIMTEAQSELLKQYGKDLVCIDSTNGMNPYDFELTTLLVMDNTRQGFPCAFFISNKNDSQTIEFFLKAVKDKVGILEAKTFMSDMTESFYNAWQNVMSECKMRLYCTWHVDCAWRKSLIMIENADKKEETYKKLRTLLLETDQDAFHCMLICFISDLVEDVDTKDFGEYFVTYYSKQFKAWASCYRLNYDINTDMQLESMHNAIKHIYLKGNSAKSPVKAVHSIMQFIKNKLFDRLIFLDKEKLPCKLKNLKTRHKKSLLLKPEIVTNIGENSWEVMSVSKKSVELYTVNFINSNCSDCPLECQECKACFHKYRCTCIDSSIKWNMCKHIHLVCRISKDISDSQNQNLLLHDEHLKIDHGKKVILNDVGNKSVKDYISIKEKRNKLIQDFSNIVQDVTTNEEYEIIKNSINSLIPVLQSKKNDFKQPEKKLKLSSIQKYSHEETLL